MKKSPQTQLGGLFAIVSKPYNAVKNRVQKTLGYESAFRGWDNDAPMSEYPTLQGIKQVFKKHAPQTPMMIVAPMLWADLVVDLAKVISPGNKNNALIPRYQGNSMDQDFAKFKPDEKKKLRLEASTSLETSRSFTRSFFKVMGMYWTKAGPKEVAIATSLAALTLYTSKESVDVLAELSNWGRDFYDFYVNAGGISGEFKDGVISSLKALHELDAYGTSNIELLQAIVERSDSLDWDILNVSQALSETRISDTLAADIADGVQAQFGDLSLDRFADSNKILQVTKILSDVMVQDGDNLVPLSAQQISSVQSALFNGENVQTAFDGISISQEAIDTVREGIKLNFSGSSLEPFSQSYQMVSQMQSVLAQAGLGAEQALEIQEKIFTNAETKIVMPELIAKIQSELGGTNFTGITSPERAEDAAELIKSLDYVLASDVLQSSGVEQNTGRLLRQVPGEFGMLLGKFLMNVLPALYAAEHLALRWQTWMTGKVSNEWLKYKNAYHVKFDHTNIDNPDQRIQENLREITDFTVSTTTDGMQNALKLATFLPMLGGMGSFNPSFLGGPDIEIENFLTWSALGYAALGTGLLGAITWNLPKLKREFQKANGDQRASLMSVHGQPEQIALTEGEDQEKRILREKHGPVVGVSKRLINKSMQIRAFNSVHANVGRYVPFLLAAPQYFAGIISFGQVSQAMGLFRSVEDSFSFIKDTIVPYSNFKAAIDRQAQLIDALELTKYEELERRYYMDLEDASMPSEGAVADQIRKPIPGHVDSDSLAPQGPEGGM